MYPWGFNTGFYEVPKVLDNRPPTLYSILNAMANFDKEEVTKIKNLAETQRGKIFDFDYTSDIPKEDLEKMILNHFLMRRIGYETVTAFKIALEVKMNEIMPYYNVLYKSIIGWDLFNDGEKLTRDATDNRKTDSTSNLNNTSESKSSNVNDNRFSDTPQNILENVKDGSYITDYRLDSNDTDSSDTSSSKGTNNVVDENISKVTENRSIADKVMLYKNYEEVKKLYTMIFKDLNDLFYSLV